MRKIQAPQNNFNTLTTLTRQSTFPFHAEPRQYNRGQPEGSFDDTKNKDPDFELTPGGVVCGAIWLAGWSFVIVGWLAQVTQLRR